MGSKKKDGVLVLVGGGVSALPPPFLKGDSDSTCACMEEKLPRLLHALREWFLPAKTPPHPLGCPRVPPFPIKGEPRQPRKGDENKMENKTRKNQALQVEQVHGFRLGSEVEKRGDLPRVGSAHLLPLAATLLGS